MIMRITFVYKGNYTAETASSEQTFSSRLQLWVWSTFGWY